MTGGFFVTTVITTVGYVARLTTGGRVFTMLYSVIGIVLVGSALGMVAQWFIDQHEARKRRQMESKCGTRGRRQSSCRNGNLRKTTAAARR